MGSARPPTTRVPRVRSSRPSTRRLCRARGWQSRATATRRPRPPTGCGRPRARRRRGCRAPAGTRRRSAPRVRSRSTRGPPTRSRPERRRHPHRRGRRAGSSRRRETRSPARPRRLRQPPRADRARRESRESRKSRADREPSRSGDRPSPRMLRHRTWRHGPGWSRDPRHPQRRTNPIHETPIHETPIHEMPNLRDRTRADVRPTDPSDHRPPTRHRRDPAGVAAGDRRGAAWTRPRR